MDKFLVGGQPEAVKLLLEEVLHRLDVVIGHALYLLDTAGIVEAEIAVDVAQGGHCVGVGAGELRQRYPGQGDEILYLYFDTVPDECKFREIAVKLLTFRAIASIYGRDGGQRSQFHGLVAINNAQK